MDHQVRKYSCPCKMGNVGYIIRYTRFSEVYYKPIWFMPVGFKLMCTVMTTVKIPGNPQFAAVVFCLHLALRPPVNIAVFTVHRTGRLKCVDWVILLTFSKRFSFFSSIFRIISIKKQIVYMKKINLTSHWTDN